MSGFSTWGGRIAAPAGFPTANSPIGPVTARDFAVNNAMHYADIHAQNRAQLAQLAGTYIEALSPVTAQWVPAWTGGSFPVSLRPDGSSYRLRVRIAGACENAAFKTRFGVSVGPLTFDRDLCYPSVATTDNVWVTGEVSSATAAYLTGATLGPEAWTTYLALTPSQVAQCAAVTGTITDVAGGPYSVHQALVRPIIWTYTEDSAHAARVYAFSLEEFPG